MKKLLWFSLLTMVSCSTSKLYTPTTKMLSPEGHGKKGSGFLEVRAGTYRRDKADFSDNTTSNRPLKKLDEPKYWPSANAEVGLIRRLDVYVNTNFLVPAPFIAGFKYQVLGDTLEEAKRKNFSLSAFAGLGRSNSGSEDSKAFIQLEDNDNKDNLKRIEFRTDHKEAGLVMGYRWADSFLHYVSGTYYHQDLSGKVTTKDKVLNKKRFDFIQTGKIYSMGLMHFFGEKSMWYIKADFSHTMYDFSFKSERTMNTFNGALGFSW